MSYVHVYLIGVLLKWLLYVVQHYVINQRSPHIQHRKTRSLWQRYQEHNPRLMFVCTSHASFSCPVPLVKRGAGLIIFNVTITTRHSSFSLLSRRDNFKIHAVGATTLRHGDKGWREWDGKLETRRKKKKKKNTVYLYAMRRQEKRDPRFVKVEQQAKRGTDKK